jgi:signal transduction histidine kinase
MIEPIRKRLGVIFFSIMIALNLVVLASIYFILHVRLMENAKEHIHQNINSEFMPHYENNDLDTLSKIIEDEHIQALDRNGNVTVDVQSSLQFTPPVNTAFLEAALSGSTMHEILTYEDERYMIAYIPLDNDHALKVTMSLEELYDFEKDFRLILLFIVPAMFLLSYFFSRYMVKQSLSPIMDVMTYQETFSSNVSHELKSPLTSIKGSVEVALRRNRSEQEYRDTLNLTLRKIDDIINLLKNLSLLAKSKFKSLDLLKEKVDTETIIQTLVEEYEPYIYSKKLKLEMSLEPHTHCMCDMSLVTRVIGNLLENAVNYSPEKGVISIKTLQDRKFFTLKISNTCRNISKSDIKSLYEPFHRGSEESDKQINGAGLGLHIVKYIVNSHSGKIDTTIEGDILTFTVKIPTE